MRIKTIECIAIRSLATGQMEQDPDLSWVTKRGGIKTKKRRTRTVSQILRDSYRLYARDRASRMAVKRCLD
jgi:hypothetical protein